jgi:phosphopantetheinyl transferase
MHDSPIVLAIANVDDLRIGQCDFLHESELRRAERFQVPRRRQEYLGGRVLLRMLLKCLTGGTRASFSIVTKENGKPVCPGGPAISIAHGGGFVACAATNHGEIGIDVEASNYRGNVLKIADRFFFPEEAAWIKESPDERFMMLWVLKEAWLKALGIGIGGGLDMLQCAISEPDIMAWASGDKPANLSLYRYQSAFVGLAATAGPLSSVRFFRWDGEADDLAEDFDRRCVATTGTTVPG